MKICRRLLLKYRIRRTGKRFGFPSDCGGTCGNRIARQLKRIEREISKILGRIYYIRDLLCMNDSRCEVTIMNQHIVEQDGMRTDWWQNCPYEAFAGKLRAEADHRPPHLRYGQFIYCRTAEMFPDAVSKIDSSADCFNDDTKVETYLYALYTLLHSNRRSNERT